MHLPFRRKGRLLFWGHDEQVLTVNEHVKHYAVHLLHCPWMKTYPSLHWEQNWESNGWVQLIHEESQAKHYCTSDENIVPI